jgi:hypothetical protein
VAVYYRTNPTTRQPASPFKAPATARCRARLRPHDGVQDLLRLPSEGPGQTTPFRRKVRRCVHPGHRNPHARLPLPTRQVRPPAGLTGPPRPSGSRTSHRSHAHPAPSACTVGSETQAGRREAPSEEDWSAKPNDPDETSRKSACPRDPSPRPPERQIKPIETTLYAPSFQFPSMTPRLA